jgi:hypothetical protein
LKRTRNAFVQSVEQHFLQITAVNIQPWRTIARTSPTIQTGAEQGSATVPVHQIEGIRLEGRRDSSIEHTELSQHVIGIARQLNPGTYFLQLVCLLKHGDTDPVPMQSQSGGQTADSGSNDRDFSHCINPLVSALARQRGPLS